MSDTKELKNPSKDLRINSRTQEQIFLGMAFLVLCLTLIGCPQGNEKNAHVQKADLSLNVITDATGIPFILPITTQRIISLAPAVTENVKILNAQDRIVGRTDFCVGISATSIGNLLEPSIEKIVELNPDLILASKDGNRPQIVEKLRSLNIRVFVFGETNSWADMESNFRLYGKLLDKINEVEGFLNQIQAELKSITTVSVSPIKVFIQLNVTPLMTAGRNTFINDIINNAGGRNIAADSILPWPTLSVEEIIRRNPDVIIISDMGQITEQAKQMWQQERFANISAVNNKKVYVMNADLLCQPTPINFIKAVRQMREYLK
ncbi:MAG: ABC transporter substrate-binding protein [Planctomycetes bacterium]|nr:ABC transporter substrate-binding protein [Planctomycetota bacterium]